MISTVHFEHRPRTRIYENIGHDGTGTWFALTAWHITRLSRSDQPVMVSVFESGTGDETFGAHRDAWFSAIVQVNGAKDWEIGESLLDPAGPPAQQLTTRAGDILLIPKNLPHAVTTPADPGHSAHLAFAIDREQPPP